MKLQEGSIAGLRNNRKSCHFWVDNEVVDCYQSIVGADAVWVYCRIARHANGAWIVSPKLRGTSDTRIGLREMAEWCGKSVDTVWRSLEVLELVGLIHAERGSKSKGRYALADVKDLVTSEDVLYDREQGSFCLPEARVAELKGKVKELRLKMSRKGAGTGAKLALVESRSGADPSTESPIASSVAQSDRLRDGASGELFAAAGAGSDRTVAPEVQNCRSSDVPSITRNLKTARTKSTPLPPASGGVEESCGASDAGKTRKRAGDLARDGVPAGAGDGARGDGSRGPGLGNPGAAGGGALLPEAERELRSREVARRLDSATTQVCSGIGLSEPRDWRKVRRQIALAAEKGDEPATIALAMMAAYGRQTSARDRGELTASYGPVKFITLGVWKNEGRWHWDEEVLRKRASASVGTAR